MVFSSLHLSRRNIVTPLVVVAIVSAYLLDLQESFGAEGQERNLPELQGDSPLRDYLVYAALNNPALEATFNRWKAAMARIPQTESLPDPRFNYAYFVQEVETRVGPQQHKLGISQMFPWFGKLKLRGEIAAKAADIAWEKLQIEKLRLFDEVKQAYFELYYLGRATAVTQENIDLLTYLEEVARSRYESGTALHGDVIKAQVELDKLRDRLQSLRDVLRPAAARLNAALNRATDAPVALPVQIESASVPFEPSALLRRMVSANPELRALEAAASQQQSAISLARKDFYPDIMAGLDYTVTGSARMPDVPDSGKDPIMFGLSINLPIWRDKYQSEVDEATYRLRAVQLDRRNRENQLSTSLELAVFRYRDANRKIALYREALIPKADQNLRAIQKAFEAGKTEFLSLIDAERVLLEFQLTYERALVDREQSISRIERLTGLDQATPPAPYEDEPK